MSGRERLLLEALRPVSSSQFSPRQCPAVRDLASSQKAHTMASFLRIRPKVALTEPSKQSKYYCFAADLHQKAIPRANAEANKSIFSQFEQHVQKYMHTKSRLDFVGMIADKEGVLLIAQHSKGDKLFNVRAGMINMMAQLPVEQGHLLQDTFRLLQDTFRPLDQIDADRIDRWISLEDLRPIPPKRMPTNLTELRNTPQEEYLGRNWDHGFDNDAPVLALPNVDETTLATTSVTNLQQHWLSSAQTDCTIVVLATGEIPDTLDFVPCKDKLRRQLLVKQQMTKDKTRDDCIVKVFRAAKKLGDEGKIPTIAGQRCRKTEFKDFCSDVTKSIEPDAETTLTNLSRENQMKIRAILGNTAEVYDGCLSDVCLDSNTTEWEMVTVGRSEVQTKKCKSCGAPGWYRRTECSCGFSPVRDQLEEAWPYADSNVMVPVYIRPCAGCKRAFKKRRGD